MKQFLTNEDGERTAVLLPIEEYRELMERLEDAEALREADEALGELERGEDEVVPLQQALREIQEGTVGGRLMPYEVVIRRKAQKQLARIQPQDRERVGAGAFGLSEDPRPPNNAIKMRGTGGLEDWRIAVGRDYRVVYRIEEPHPDHPEPEEGEPAGLVTVLAVGHRQGIYG